MPSPAETRGLHRVDLMKQEEKIILNPPSEQVSALIDDLVDRHQTPPPGYQIYEVQEIKVQAKTVTYQREVWEGPDGTIYYGELPKNIKGHYGPELRAMIHELSASGMTQPAIYEYLISLGINISNEELHDIIVDEDDAFAAKSAEILKAGLKSATNVKEDDTSAKHKHKNWPGTNIRRNDPCRCGSGLKYKKCCLSKANNIEHSEITFEAFKVKFDALTPAESQNNFPTLASKDQALVSALGAQLRDHPETITSESCEFFQQLNTLRTKYPAYPVILHYISAGYKHLGKTAEFKKLTAEMYKKFPDYIFARTAQAMIYLIDDGYPEKAFEIFKGACSVKELYPHRTVFHCSEVAAFEYFMARYFYSTGDMTRAKSHLKVMQTILKEDDPLLLDVQRLLTKSTALDRITAGISGLLNRRKKRPKS